MPQSGGCAARRQAGPQIAQKDSVICGCLFRRASL